jgi:cation diffusion facilitator family transporter
MNAPLDIQFGIGHEHVFLGEGHDKNARKTWAVIALCGVMMVVEIVGGSIFGSLALVADGLHMSTHASAMLIAALAYTFARKHAQDRRFVFGTGKLGDLAGFTSAIILAMIALLIGYEAVSRFLAPVPIRFSEAIPIAVLGLVVNIVSAWLLSGGDHGHSHGHSHGHGHSDHADDHHEHADEAQRVETAAGTITLSVFEDGVPPVFRIEAESPDVRLTPPNVTVTTERVDGSRQIFAFEKGSGDFLESTQPIPEPHAFRALITLGEETFAVEFSEHEHHDEHSVDARDHNIRAAYIHVMADAAVSVLAIIGLLLAKTFGWLWMDPLAGIVGAFVIANWSYGLIRVTGAILVDITPDESVANKIKSVVELSGDKLVDLHVWRLGPGHLGAVVSVVSSAPTHGPAFYHSVLQRFKGLSHITVEVHQQPLPA